LNFFFCHLSACIDAIVLHTSSLDEFLKRQKVTKENLFRYLNDRKISVPNTDKSALELQIKQLINGPHSGNYGIVQAQQTPAKMPEAHTQLLAKGDILNNSMPWSNAVQPVQANTVNPAVWNQGTQAGVSIESFTFYFNTLTFSFSKVYVS